MATAESKYQPSIWEIKELADQGMVRLSDTRWLLSAHLAMLDALELARRSLGWQYLSAESKLVVESAIRFAKGE